VYFVVQTTVAGIGAMAFSLGLEMSIKKEQVVMGVALAPAICVLNVLDGRRGCTV